MYCLFLGRSILVGLFICSYVSGHVGLFLHAGAFLGLHVGYGEVATREHAIVLVAIHSALRTQVAEIVYLSLAELEAKGAYQQVDLAHAFALHQRYCPLAKHPVQSHLSCLHFSPQYLRVLLRQLLQCVHQTGLFLWFLLSRLEMLVFLGVGGDLDAVIGLFVGPGAAVEVSGQDAILQRV